MLCNGQYFQSIGLCVLQHDELYFCTWLLGPNLFHGHLHTCIYHSLQDFTFLWAFRKISDATCFFCEKLLELVKLQALDPSFKPHPVKTQVFTF